MNDVLKDVIGKYVLVYLYDIVIFSCSRCKVVQPELQFVCVVVGVQVLPVDPKTIFHCTRLASPQAQDRAAKFLGPCKVHHGLGSVGGCTADTAERHRSIYSV